MNTTVVKLSDVLGKVRASEQEGRRRLQESAPRVTLTERHTAGAMLLPSREAMLDRLPKKAVACEIGVANGDFSAAILQLAEPSILHLVDAWDDPRYAADFAVVEYGFRNKILDGTVKIHRGFSTDRLPEFPENYFDWVYIDTDHSYATTARELEICVRKVKPEGLIAGHDFCTGNVVTPYPYGVIEACLEFCEREEWGFKYLALSPDGHFSFCLHRLTKEA
ncbi:class I SAM-dependent methyltransferase [Flaviflagellibacter deserti]|uniref:Class I SAM-dependent methyltransferase n=1 Tax=Flaviflagellibacter deserti TaxID=2267266 RepID=A0ABV9Z1Y0_9HYPH